MGKRKGWENPFFTAYVARDVQEVDLPIQQLK